MKEIERFLNHLYYAVYCMTAWIAFEPTRKQEEYESSLELTWVLHGLSYFYIFDTLLFILTICELVSGYSLKEIFKNELFLTIFMMVLIIPMDEIIFHYFVYRGKKYLEYCREYEKESRLTKIMWCFFVVFLYILAIILFVLIFKWGQTYMAK